MKAKSVNQYAIVRSDSASLFEEQLNARILELSDKNPSVAFSESGEYLIARIGYTERFEIEDKPLEETGITFQCSDCPNFRPIRKADGTIDHRCKYGDCDFAEFGRTYKDSRACRQLYLMIKNGGIKLCCAD